jgi:hypothetical protein
MCWVGQVDRFVTDLLRAYAAHDCDRIREMRDYCCGSDDHGATEEMKDIIAWANRG